VRALSLLGAAVPELTVRANTVFELTDDFFDGGPAQSAETEWFQVDAKRHEIFLDDDTSTLRLANRRVLQTLHGHQNHPLVSWFGYKAEAYDLVLHAPNEAPGAGSLDTNRIAWIAWDYRVWRTYLFDGAKLIPVTRTGAATAGLELDVNSITWMGWDGENLDIFVSELPHVSEGTVAVFVGKDDSVMTAQKPIR
jgi:hypothetical protein